MTMMKLKKTVLVFLGLMFVATSAGAQTKITGTIQCAKPDTQNATPVGDRAGHALVVMKGKCKWTKPMEVAGVETKTGDDTVFADSTGTKSRDTGYHISTMANGDQFVVRFSGATTTDKNGVVQAQTGTWSFVSGTGKMKGIAGKGTYKGKGADDGSVTTDVEGEYQMAGK
jgi:hypothetical protein